MSPPAAQSADSGPAGDDKRGSTANREDMAALTLDGRGMICDCNRACETLFDAPRSKLVWQHVSALLPQLAEFELMQNGQPNQRLMFLSRIGHHFQASTKNDAAFVGKLFFNRVDGAGHDRIRLLVRPAETTIA